MGNKVVVLKNGVEEVFEDVLGHQVGYSHVQILIRNGDQRIISGFDSIDITLDDETSERFQADLANKEAEAARALEDEPEVATQEGNVVEIKH